METTIYVILWCEKSKLSSGSGTAASELCNWNGEKDEWLCVS